MSPHIPGYDYRQPNFYYITICVLKHQCRFGKIFHSEMRLNPLGEIAYTTWQALPRRFPHINIHEFIIMPNHMHGIVEMTEPDPPTDDSILAHNEERQDDTIELIEPDSLTTSRAPLWRIMGYYKGTVSYKIHRLKGKPWFEWQDGFYESIIRTEASLARYRNYTINNPATWAQDKLYKRY